MSRRDAAPDRGEAFLDLVALGTLGVFIVLPMLAFAVVASPLLPQDRSTPSSVLVILLSGSVFASASVLLGLVLWLATMRFFLPARVLRRWALYGPQIPALARIATALCDGFLGPDEGRADGR